MRLSYFLCSCARLLSARYGVLTHTCARLNSYCCAAERSRLSIDRDMRFHLAIMMDREPVYAQSFITTLLPFLCRLYFILFSLSLSSVILSILSSLFTSRCLVTSFAKRTTRFVLMGPVLRLALLLRINRLSGSRQLSSGLDSLIFLDPHSSTTRVLRHVGRDIIQDVCVQTRTHEAAQCARRPREPEQKNVSTFFKQPRNSGVIDGGKNWRIRSCVRDVEGGSL